MKASHMEKRDKSLPAESSPPATSQRRTLETLFRHPSAKNIEWGDALALFEVLGEVEHKDNDKWMLQVGGECQLMHQPHGKDLTGLEVVQLRKFLQRAGWSAKGEMGTPCEATQKPRNLLVVLDHHDSDTYARVVREVVADLSSITPAKLLEIAEQTA